MNPQTHPIHNQKLVDDCLSHLVAERKLLERFIELSQTLHDSLGRSVFPDINASLPDEKQLASEAATVAEARIQFRRAIADHLGIPESEGSIRKFAETLDKKDAAPLMAERERIFELSKQITQLSESNSLLLRQSVDIYQRLLQSLAGQPVSSPTYSPRGQVNQQATVSLVSTQG